MRVEDGLKIVRGGDTSVSDIFATKSRQPLGEKFLPIVTRATAKVALAAKDNAVAGTAVGHGFVMKEDANVRQCVTSKTLEGLYLMIGGQERRIRRDPVTTGSEILKKVFGR